MVDKPTSHERRRSERRNISYYLPVMDSKTGEVIGHIVDMSPVGFMMDSKVPVASNTNFDLHLDFMEEIAGRAFFDFAARCIWCHPDPIQPYLHNIGFEFITLPPQDMGVIASVIDKYGGN
jgi:hypothetical protein